MGHLTVFLLNWWHLNLDIITQSFSPGIKFIMLNQLRTDLDLVFSFFGPDWVDKTLMWHALLKIAEQNIKIKSQLAFS
jgi:hypothetical protein